MRRELKKALRQRFDLAMKESLPDFQPAERQEAPAGDSRLYVWRAREGLSLFIRLLLSHKDERFTVEIGWSTDGCFHGGPTTSDPDAPAQAGGVSFRLSRLWKRGGTEQWWELSRLLPTNAHLTMSIEEQVARLGSGDYVQEGLANVDSMVDEAISLTREHALPYFQRILGKC